MSNTRYAHAPTVLRVSHLETNFVLPIPVEEAFDRLAVDCLGPFPVTWSGKRYLVVFTEYLSKWPEIFAVSNIDAITIAKLLTDEIIPRHGAPRTLLRIVGRISSLTLY